MDTEKGTSSNSSIRGVLKGLVVGVLITVVVGFVGGNWRVDLTGWDFLVLPILLLIVLGTHEISHLIGGWSQGMRLLVMTIGPFGWRTSPSGVRFVWNTDLAAMGGAVAVFPTNVNRAFRRHWLLLSAAGPLGSLLLAVVSLVLALTSGSRLTTYCMIIAAASFGVFLMTIVPIRSGAFVTDGMRMIDDLRDGRGVRWRNAYMLVSAQTLKGVRPRDWDAAAIDELSKADSDNPLFRTTSRLFLFVHAMDRGHDADIARYRTLLEGNLDGVPSRLRHEIHVELAIGAWLAGDTVAVRRHLTAGKDGTVDGPRRLLAQAALARLEGRHEACERDRFLALEALAKEPDAEGKQLTEDQLERLASSSWSEQASSCRPSS